MPAPFGWASFWPQPGYHEPTHTYPAASYWFHDTPGAWDTVNADGETSGGAHDRKIAFQAPGPLVVDGTPTSGNDHIFDGSEDRSLHGGSGKDVLHAGAGDDTLNGGTGIDRLTGGSGTDTFVFVPLTERDTITDFEPGKDRIDLTAFADRGLASMDDLGMSQLGASTVVHLVGSDAVILQGIALDALNPDNFLF
ncbi:hypothetical protein J1C49_10265 [Cognatishimia sp. F0-27]|nr:hypothetical protein [Cognatishimia sp. F0-27]